MSFKIIRNAKPPGLKKIKYPFENMEIGDVFYIPCHKDLCGNVQAQVHNAARRFRINHNPDFRITVRRTEAKGKFSVAVFRVS